MTTTDSTLHRVLTWVAVGTAVLVVVSLAYTYVFQGDAGSDLNYRRGNLRLEEGNFAEALENFDNQLLETADHLPARLGRALSLMGLERTDDALDEFGYMLQVRQDFAPAFANRGILQDRLGLHEQALQDYRRALELDPSLGEGPGWLTRFLRSQWDAPPTLADRARYIEQQLKLPPEERRLRDPEQDNAQRSYKVTGKL